MSSSALFSQQCKYKKKLNFKTSVTAKSKFYIRFEFFLKRIIIRESLFHHKSFYNIGKMSENNIKEEQSKCYIVMIVFLYFQAMTRLNHLGLTLSTPSRIRFQENVHECSLKLIIDNLKSNPLIKITGDGFCTISKNYHACYCYENITDPPPQMFIQQLK